MVTSVFRDPGKFTAICSCPELTRLFGTGGECLKSRIQDVAPLNGVSSQVNASLLRPAANNVEESSATGADRASSRNPAGSLGMTL